MICKICAKNQADSGEICQSCLDAVKKVWGFALHPRRAAVPATKPTRRYFFITQGNFSTIVDGRDANSPEEAIELACKDEYQPWYLTTTHSIGQCSYIIITHSDVCDWYRHRKIPKEA